MYSKNILILTDWSYKDALIQTYTLPYVKMIRKNLSPGKSIFLRTLEQPRFKTAPQETKEIKDQLSSVHGIQWIPFEYYSGIRVVLSVVSFIRLLFLCWRERIGVIHIWCTPPSIMAYCLQLFTGAAIVIDSYEPHAEAMVENGNWEKGSLKFKLLFFFEKKISRKARVIISATEGMKKYAKEKYNASFEKFYVKPACVDTSLFSYENRKKDELVNKFELQGKIVCVYAGKFGGIYLDKEIFRFLKTAHDFYGDKFRVLILTSHTRQEIESFCRMADLDPGIVITQFVSHNDIPDYMGLGDFALTPVKPVPTKRYCTPIKDGEYWALGLPVVITANISDDSEIIENNGIGVVIQDFTEESYRQAIEKIENIRKSIPAKDLYEKIRIIAVRYRSFDIAERIYSQIYE